MLKELQSKGRTYPRKLKEFLPHPSIVLQAETNLFTAYGRFVQAGKQIFNFHRVLTEMLTNTDVDEIPLNSIILPYSSQYLYFGVQHQLEIAPNWYIDGAYVESRGELGDIRFVITAVPKESDHSKFWYVIPEEHYSQDFIEKYRSLNLGEAMELVQSEKMLSLERKANESAKGLSINNPYYISDITEKMNLERKKIDNRCYPVYVETLKLIVNALCYINAYQEDVKKTWDKEPPENIMNLMQNGSEKEQKKAKAKAKSLGYRQIYLCGTAVQKSNSNIVEISDSDKHKITHWRRGHWRNQRYGEKRMLSKLLWIKPMIIGKNNEDIQGHEYHIKH